MEEAISERIITPMAKALVSAIDDFRFANRMPSRAEAIRRLIELGLAAAAVPATDGQLAPVSDPPASGMHVAGATGGTASS